MNVIGYTEFGNIAIVVDGLEMTVPDDMSNRHRQNIAEWEAAGNTIPPYAAPPAPVSSTISRRQFFQVLANRGLISRQEALDAVTLGSLPAAIESILESIADDDVQWNARMSFSAQSFDRANWCVAFFGAMQNMSSADIDDIWRDGAELD